MRALLVLGLLICIAAPANAGVIGDIGTPDDQQLSKTLESLFVAQAAKGVLPVETYVVQQDDTIQDVLRRRSLFKGAYFPVIIDSVTCDLNPNSCTRPRVPTASTPLSETVELVNSPLSFEPTPGVWSTLHPGDTIVIPSFHVYQMIVPKTYEKKSGERLSSIIQRDAVCAQSDNKTCASFFDFFNSTIPDYKSDSFAGEMQIPAYDYSIDISDTCEALCALVKNSVAIEPKTGQYLETPFEIVTTSKPSSATDEPGCLATYGCKLQTVDPKYIADYPSVDVDQLPADLRAKIDSGKQLIDTGSWTQSLNLKPMSEDDDFDSSQAAELGAVNYPKDPLEPKQTATVMIIDSFFDLSHCSFPAGMMKVVDCRDSSKGTCPVSEAAPIPRPRPNPDSSANNAAPPLPVCGHAGGNILFQPAPSMVSAGGHNHGTHLAGIIGARRDGAGIGGLNPHVRIIGLEVGPSISDNGYAAWLAPQIGQAIMENSVNVVNISLDDGDPATLSGSDGRPRNWLSDLFKHFKQQALFVVSAGNEPDPLDDCRTMPACLAPAYPNVVAVVGLNTGVDDVFEQANTNPGFTLGTLADNVPGTWPDNTFAKMSGSSQAAALVSGASSLALSSMGSVSPAALKGLLVACSNIKSKQLLSDMIGGALDVNCLVHGTEDSIQLSDGVKFGRVSGLEKVDNGEMLSSVPFHVDYDDTHVEIPWEHLVGFQRLPFGSGRVALFKSDNEGLVTKLVGRFDTPFKLLLDNDEAPVNVNEIDKFVRGIS